ncbi:MAG: MATE family efflux transporter [Butyrivibrio sp.]|nr:MATE family efflux transporter [Butyrivibrio sp.]
MELDMTKGRPLPIILKFMLPIFLGNIFQQFYNMVDTIIVGRYVGANALAAVGSTGTIMFLVLGFSQGLTTGFTVLTSQSYGAGDLKRVKRSVANGVILAAIVVVITTLLSVSLINSLLRLMNTPEDIFADASAYITTICYGIVASVYYNLFSAYMRAVGNSRTPLYFLIFSAFLNILLDLVFIILFKLGVTGAALATNISQGFSAILCLIYIYKKIPLLAPEKKDWHLESHDTRHQMGVGLPMALQFGITAAGTMIMQAAINMFGSTAVAAFTAASKLGGLLTQEMNAMGQAMSTYSGQNFGNGDVERIKQGVKSTLIANIIYSIIAAIAANLLLTSTLGLFFSGSTPINELIPWAKTYIIVSSLFYAPLSFIFIFRNAMQGCGYGFLPMMGGVVELVARMIAAFIAMNISSYALAVACDPIAWLAAAIYTGICYIFVIKDVQKRLKNYSHA